MVMAELERGVTFVFRQARTTTDASCIRFVNQHAPNSKRITIDESAALRQWPPRPAHETIEHSAKEYARGYLNTITVEGAFACSGAQL